MELPELTTAELLALLNKELGENADEYPQFVLGKLCLQLVPKDLAGVNTAATALWILSQRFRNVLQEEREHKRFRDEIARGRKP
jgi:hypothetical protein